MSVAPEPVPDPTPTGTVQRRFVVRARGPAGQPSRVTVVDRSGRVTGARVPSERELRFWTPLGAVGPLAPID